MNYHCTNYPIVVRFDVLSNVIAYTRDGKYLVSHENISIFKIDNNIKISELERNLSLFLLDKFKEIYKDFDPFKNYEMGTLEFDTSFYILSLLNLINSYKNNVKLNSTQYEICAKSALALSALLTRPVFVPLDLPPLD